MTPTDLSQQARERAEKATSGPWQSRHGWDRDGICEIIGDIDGPDEGRMHYRVVCNVADDNSDWPDDAAFIAAARTDVPALCDAIDAQAKEIERLRGALEKIERWFGEFPPTEDFWDDGEPMSYFAVYGSNGERDFMRDIARAALSQEPTP